MDGGEVICFDSEEVDFGEVFSLGGKDVTASGLDIGVVIGLDGVDVMGLDSGW